jgi:hypothetical protein
MTEEHFIGEEVQVEQAGRSPRPVRFVWRGETHEVAEVVSMRVDTGFGGLPPRSRRWYTRRHRRYYVVRNGAGSTFEMYLDYADKAHRKWILVRKHGRFP